MCLLKKYNMLAAAFILAAASVFSCSKKEEGPDNVQPPPDFVPISEIHSGNDNYYLIVKDLDEPYWKVLANGATASAMKYDVNVYMSGTYDETDINSQAELVYEAEKLGADAVIIAPDDAVKLSDCVTALHNDEIPVILADTVVNCSDYDVCYMTDNIIAGREAAKEMLLDLEKNGVSKNEEASVAIMTGAITVPTLNERVAGFCGYWAEYAPENWKLLDEITKNESCEAAIKSARDCISKHNNVKGIFATNYFTSAGAASLIHEEHLTDVALVGFDYTAESNSLMLDESFTVSMMLQKNYDMGFKAVEACKSIRSGNTPSQKYVDTGVIVINRETRNSTQVQELLSQY